MADFSAVVSGLPQTSPYGDNNNGKYKSRKSGSGWCTEDVKSTMTVIGVWIGVMLFAAFLIAIWVKREDLDATTRATVGMHDDTIRLKQVPRERERGTKKEYN
jgi:hypothetical protein